VCGSVVSHRAGARLCRHLPRNYQRVLDWSWSTPGSTDGLITSRSWPLPGLSTALARLGTAQVPRSKPCRLTLLSAALRSKMPLPTDDRSRHAPNDRHPVNASFANGDQQVRSNSAVETCLACPVRPTTRMDPDPHSRASDARRVGACQQAVVPVPYDCGHHPARRPKCVRP
jgi:hypothetical protein